MNCRQSKSAGNGDSGGMNWGSGCRTRAPKRRNNTLAPRAPLLQFEALTRICRTCGKCRIGRKHLSGIRGMIGA
jgi:hypothetical protein